MTAPVLKVVSGGLNTTVQDLGRRGYQKVGLPVAGALDWVSLRIANALVGNRQDEAALEISYLGPTLEVMAGAVRVALVGTRSGIEVAGEEPRRIAANESARLRRGERFRIGSLGDSAVAYLAIEGGIAVPEVQGSRSTLAKVRLGGFKGRALADGDLLPIALDVVAEQPEQRLTPPALSHNGPFRVVLGPQDDHFTAEQRALFLGATYTIGRATDRMGARLEGPAFPHRISIVSDAIAPGSIQVPGNGLPIVLMADRQTTGGYPKIATLISADLPFLGRLGPGARLAFAAVSVEAAEEARRNLEQRLTASIASFEAAGPGRVLDERRLHEANLISGVVHGGEGAILPDGNS